MIAPPATVKVTVLVYVPVGAMPLATPVIVVRGINAFSVERREQAYDSSSSGRRTP